MNALLSLAIMVPVTTQSEVTLVPVTRDGLVSTAIQVNTGWTGQHCDTGNATRDHELRQPKGCRSSTRILVA